ncbi:MAG: large-conductance mechanosensitive channel protein MscL [Clostridia bacterium]|nr:large-conductance mechanosensitive channel protein MscL [Clostridia bacterium]
MKKFFNEFKAFALKGNMLDLAIGVVIGGAFTGIINSIVNDIIMPIVGLLCGGLNFSFLAYRVPFGKGETIIAYGNLIQVFVNFVIVALCLFLVVKAMNRFKKKEEEKPAAKPADVELLEEIRDILKEKK